MGTQAQNPETIDTRLLLKVLMAFQKGDFSARLPIEKTGTVGKIYDALNDVIERNENMTNELVQVNGSVAKEGKIGERAALSGAGGSWMINANSMEGMIDDLIRPGNQVVQAQRLAQRCAGAACVIVLLALAGWLMGAHFLAGQFGTVIPTPPSTALLAFVLAGGVLSQARWSTHRLSRRLALAAAGFTVVAAFMVLAQRAFGFDLGVESMLSRITASLGTIPLGRMSPLTALGLLLEGGALMFLLHAARSHLAATIAALLALIAIVANLLFLMGYAYGSPFVYGGTTIPVAVPTALILLLVGVGELNLAEPWLSALRGWGRGSIRGLLLRAFLPGMLGLVVFQGWLDTVGLRAKSENPALWEALTALLTCALLVALANWTAHRASEVIDRARKALWIKGLALESSLSALAISDPRGILSYVNHAFLKLWRYDSLAEVLGKPLIGFWQAAEEQLYITAMLGPSGSWIGESKAKNKDGEFFDVDVSASLARDNAGQPVCTVTSFTDITERKRAEECTNRYLSALQREHAASDCMNQELQEKAKLLSDQKTEVEAKNDQVERARRDLEEKAAQLTLTSKYKSEFLANMSHELRSPLNNLLILAKLLADNAEGNLTEKQTKFAHTIHSSGTDLLTLINDILDLARVESGKMNIEPAAVYLADLRELVIQDFSHVALSKGTEFRVHVDPGLPDSIQTDPTRLRQVLKNLMSNALKFTERGSVRMEIKPAKSGWRPGASGLDRAGRVVAFSVVDTGIGIPPEKHRTVFEAFQQADGTTSRRYGGTGLGLSISRDIAQLLGGDLTLESQVGVGSIFTLFLPEICCEETRPSRPAAEAALIPAAPPCPRPQGLASACDAVAMSALARLMAAQEPVEDDHLTLRKTDRPVLIVENDATFAGVLLEKVHARGLKGVVVMRGGPVVRMVREMAPGAITLDILLPDMSGWVVLEALKRDLATRHVPVHVVTICEERRRAMAMGAASFLHKTMTPGTLDQVFDRIVAAMKAAVRKVLVVDGDTARRPSLVELLGNGDIHTIPAASGAEVAAALREHEIDGAVLGWNVPGLPGLDLLATLRDATGRGDLRVLIYPAAPLTPAETAGIAAWDDAAVIQIASSPEDLLDKSMTMFHRKETELPREQRDKLAAARAVDRRLAGRKILIVDDDLRNIFALTSALETHDMNLALAENGQKGIEALRANPDVELVLMDIMLPEMDGYQAMRAIRKMPEYRELPVIALTAQAMKGDRERCIEAGATDYIAKPVEIDQLLALMRVWLPEARKDLTEPRP